MFQLISLGASRQSPSARQAVGAGVLSIYSPLYCILAISRCSPCSWSWCCTNGFKASSSTRFSPVCWWFFCCWLCVWLGFPLSSQLVLALQPSHPCGGVATFHAHFFFMVVLLVANSGSSRWCPWLGVVGFHCLFTAFHPPVSRWFYRFSFFVQGSP